MISLLRSQLFKQTLLDIPLILSESNLAMLNAPCLMIVPAIHLHGQCGVSQLASDCQQAYLLISPIIAALWLMFDPYHFIILYWRWLHPFTSSRNIQCYPMRSPFFLVKSQLFQRFLRLVSIYIYIYINPRNLWQHWLSLLILHMMFFIYTMDSIATYPTEKTRI